MREYSISFCENFTTEFQKFSQFEFKLNFGADFSLKYLEPILYIYLCLKNYDKSIIFFKE